tara:strand:- start:4281 stop:4640 length:360 start_codon:yes stop_codon:yes gene_type:complete
MKLTKARLKCIINEEFNRIEEVDNARVHISTAQSQMDDLNQTSDPTLTSEICALLDQIVSAAANITDPSMKAAVIEHAQSFKTLVDEIRDDKIDRDNEEVEMPDQTMGGFEVDPLEHMV